MIAAKSDTSINALFNAELRHLVETFEAAEAGSNQNFKTLLDFSLGRIADHQALVALGIDSQEDLFLLMAQAHLSIPRLPDAVTQDMVDSLHALAPDNRPDVSVFHRNCLTTRCRPADHAGLCRFA